MVVGFQKCADWALCACILLLCFSEVPSSPTEGNFGAWGGFVSQGIREPAMRSSSFRKMFNPLYNNMQHGMGGIYPAVNQMESGYLNQESQQLPGQLIYSHEIEQGQHGEHLFKPKRDSRVQVRSPSTSRARTVLRIQAPCAGTNQHSQPGSSLFAPSIEINARGLLQSLASEAVTVQRMAQQVLRRMEAEGVNQQVALVLGQEAVLHSGLGSQAYPPTGSDQVVAALGVIYQQLSRAALVLEEIAEDANPRLISLVTTLKENGIYNLLCGIKIAMDAKDPSVIRNPTAILGTSRVMRAPNSAFRLARDYSLIREVARFLTETGGKLDILSLIF